MTSELMTLLRQVSVNHPVRLTFYRYTDSDQDSLEIASDGDDTVIDARLHQQLCS